MTTAFLPGAWKEPGSRGTPKAVSRKETGARRLPKHLNEQLPKGHAAVCKPLWTSELMARGGPTGLPSAGVCVCVCELLSKLLNHLN